MPKWSQRRESWEEEKNWRRDRQLPEKTEEHAILVLSSHFYKLWNCGHFHWKVLCSPRKGCFSCYCWNLATPNRTSCFHVYGLLIIAFLVIFIRANREVSARPQRKLRESMSVKGRYFWRVGHPIPGEALISYRVPLRDHQRGHVPPMEDNKKELRWPKDKHLLYLWNVNFSAKYLMLQNTYLSKNNLNPSSTL